MAAAAGNSVFDIRNTAVVLAALFGMLRPSEIVGLNRADVEIREEGALLTIHDAKGDRAKETQLAFLPRRSECCPVTALERWLDTASGVPADGPLFCSITAAGHPTGTRLHRNEITRIIKRQAEKAGVDPERLSGHSGRRGFATSYALKDGNLARLMKKGRWKNLQTMMAYIDDAVTMANDIGTDL